jgi:hypothetical protein
MGSLFGGGGVPQRNLTREMKQTAAGYRATAPLYYDLEKQYQPLYNLLGLGVRQQNLFGTPQQPGTLAQNATANTFTRGADIADVARYGPAATQAFLAANPGLRRSLDVVQGNLTPDPLLTALQQQAQSQVAAGGALTPEEQRLADQQVRAGYAARGMTQGNQSLAAEILNRDALRRQRIAAAQQFALGTEGASQAQRDFAGRAAQIFSTTLSDPFQAILGRTSGAGGGGGGGGYPQAIGTGARMFDPTNPYAQDVYNSNFNARNAQNIANQNTETALGAGALSSSAAVLAAILPGLIASDKRLKTNIRKVGKTPGGVLLSSFSYKGDETRPRRKFIGAVAQDVEKVAPQAVVRDPVTGYRKLNYGAIDAPFMELAAA